MSMRVALELVERDAAASRCQHRVRDDGSVEYLMHDGWLRVAPSVEDLALRIIVEQAKRADVVKTAFTRLMDAATPVAYDIFQGKTPNSEDGAVLFRVLNECRNVMAADLSLDEDYENNDE